MTGTSTLVDDAIAMMRGRPGGWQAAPPRAGSAHRPSAPPGWAPDPGYREHMARRRAERERRGRAAAALQQWAAGYRQRDRLVREARAAGLPDAEISRLTGMARTTLARIR